MQVVKQYGKNIINELIEATFDPSLIYEFFCEQIDACQRINPFFPDVHRLYSLDNLGREKEHILSAISITQASILKDLLEMNSESIDPVSCDPYWEQIKLRVVSIKNSLVAAKLEPFRVKEFLETQLDVFREVHANNQEKFSKEEFTRNERKILNISLLIKALS